ncbi:MAG: DNA polymerase, partial [Thermoplasmata archaeon M11B2D]
MKLSSEALQVLKNFSTICKGLSVSKGNVLRTTNPGRTVLAEATLEEDFPKSFSVYDLTELLGVLSLF